MKPRRIPLVDGPVVFSLALAFVPARLATAMLKPSNSRRVGCIVWFHRGDSSDARIIGHCARYDSLRGGPLHEGIGSQ